jgi:hypothetical protein
MPFVETDIFDPQPTTFRMPQTGSRPDREHQSPQLLQLASRRHEAATQLCGSVLF